MKLHILSDLHNECSRFKPPFTDADVVVLAGDIDKGTMGVRWAKLTFAQPVIYLAGNHEFYGGDIDTDYDALRRAATNSQIHFLECDTVVIHGVRFIGTTLWTDFRLGSADPDDAADGMRTASRRMNDYRRIRNGERQFTPEDSMRLFESSVAYIQKALATPFDGKTVVVTHHSPSLKSIHPRYAGNPVNGAFSSDLEYLMQGSTAPALWVHGHTHDSFDYVVNGQTRVVANPRGYTNWMRIYEQENEAFRSAFVVEV